MGALACAAGCVFCGAACVVGSVVKGAGCVVNTVVQCVVQPVACKVGQVVQKAIDNPIQTLGDMAAVFTGNPELIPLINGANTYAQTGCLGSALKSAGTAYVGSQVFGGACTPGACVPAPITCIPIPACIPQQSALSSLCNIPAIDGGNLPAGGGLTTAAASGQPCIIPCIPQQSPLSSLANIPGNIGGCLPQGGGLSAAAAAPSSCSAATA